MSRQRNPSKPVELHDTTRCSNETESTAPESSRRTERWTHTPRMATIIWLCVSIPLVIWDLLYVSLRPFSMPGGSLHSPYFTPYALYVETDYVYGWKAFNEGNGFTMAQAGMNGPETILYGIYLWVVWKGVVGNVGGVRRYIEGKEAGIAVLAGFMGAVMTCSKTMLYALNEHFSAYANVGHNSWRDLVVLWIIPNGAWLFASCLMTVHFGREILRGLEIASAAGVEKDEHTLPGGKKGKSDAL